MTLDLHERDRRYGLLREKMAAQGLDARIVISSAQINQDKKTCQKHYQRNGEESKWVHLLVSLS